MTVTPRVSILIILAVIPAIITNNYLLSLIWVATVFVVTAIDYITLNPIKKITVNRTVPPSIRNGEEFTSTVTIQNPTKRNIKAIVRDAWQPSAGLQNDRQKICIKAQTATNLNFILKPTRRGTKTADYVTIKSYGKLKLACKQRSFEAPAQITILPEFKSRKELPGKLQKLKEIEGAISTHLRGKGAEFDSMRKYVTGDDIRDIDWRASARTQNLIVKSWHPEQDRKVLIIVDISRLSAIRLGNEPRLDSHIETCLLLSALATHAHDKIEIMIVSSTIQSTIIPKEIKNIISDIAHNFANIFPQLKEITWTTYIPTIKSKLKNGGIIVFITPIDQNIYSNGLLKTLLHLNKGNTIIVASSYKNEFDMLTDSSDAYDKAAAASSQLIRDEIKYKLTMNKIHIVEADANELPGKVCDKYLQIKAKGLI